MPFSTGRGGYFAWACHQWGTSVVSIDSLGLAFRNHQTMFKRYVPRRASEDEYNPRPSLAETASSTGGTRVNKQNDRLSKGTKNNRSVFWLGRRFATIFRVTAPGRLKSKLIEDRPSHGPRHEWS
jgi:hypothetical protein